ncbi:MAG: hypothetical protein LBE85_04270 [Candidatus Accumulibacter sp.]|nr:hypothetical protein [Accumulibacter sp.]
MASKLSLMIGIGAKAGSAFAVFGNLKGVMQRVADVTKNLKAQQSALGKTIKDAAQMPQADLARLNAQYTHRQQLLTSLRASTVTLGRSRAAIANNEARRASLRGKRMETANAIHRRMGRAGEFWQRECFARPIRSDEHSTAAVAHVENNPLQAGWAQSARTR